jgi:CelD/BcsL family acetyltransferase involved in cellulose biosynthesis
LTFCFQEWRSLVTENIHLRTDLNVSPSLQTSDVLGDLGPCSHSHGIRTVTVRDFAGLAPHHPAWDRLAWEAPQQVATLLPDWVETFLQHRLKPTENWFCSFAYAGERLIGVLPVIVAPHPVLGRRWPRLRTSFDEHTPSGDIVLAPDHAGAALRALLTEVAREVPRHFGLVLKAVRQSSPVWRALQEEPAGFLLRCGTRWKYSFLDVQGDYDRYFTGLGSMRRSLRISRERLEKHGTVSVEMRRGMAASEEFLVEFLALEASGWKGSMGTAILKNPDLVTFYTSLVRRFAAKGRLEWHAIRVEGRLVAAQLAVRCGASLMLPKYAYDEDFAECTPGHLLRGEVIKEAFSRPELVEFNPMSDANQHRLFHMPRDEYVDVHLIRRTISSVLYHRTCMAMKSVYREHIRPRIPLAMKEAYRKLKRRRNQKRGEKRKHRPPA